MYRITRKITPPPHRSKHLQRKVRSEILKRVFFFELGGLNSIGTDSFDMQFCLRLVDFAYSI